MCRTITPLALSLVSTSAVSTIPPISLILSVCHIAVVEVDKETGKVQLTRFVAVDDVGNIINPMIVEGQIHGGVVQGLDRHYSKVLNMTKTASLPMALIWTIACRVQTISR